MNITEELNSAHNPEIGPEQGLRSGSTAGDSHGETSGGASEKEENVDADETPGERRKELLKEEPSTS